MKGLFYVGSYLDAFEMLQWTTFVRKNVIFKHPFSNRGRRVAQFGYSYSYNGTGITELKNKIPTKLTQLVNPTRINNSIGKNLVTEPFNQLIINEYKKGQGITAHTDHPKQFGPIIACITLGDEGEMIFEKKGEESIRITVKPGSLYLMSGEARYNWKHSMRKNSNKKGERYSFTFRTIV